MPIDVTVRHAVVSSALQKYVRTAAAEMLEEFPSAIHIHLVLDVAEHGRKKSAEVIVRVKRHGTKEATATADNWRLAVDEAFDRLERQLRKLQEREEVRRR